MIARAPITGADGQKLAPKDILQIEGFDDHWAPNTGIEAYATALGGNQIFARDTNGSPFPLVKGLLLRGRDLLNAPVMGNLGGKTVVLTQFRAPPGTDGHDVSGAVPQAVLQWENFLQTKALSGTATLEP
jgi:hypothetical protein